MILEVTNNFAAAEQDIANSFFQQYFLSILQDILFVLTDADHKSGFKIQSVILARLFQLVETGQIKAPLFDPGSVPDPSMTNSVYLREYCANLLKTAFPHMQSYVGFIYRLIVLIVPFVFSRSQIQTFVFSLGELHDDINRFKLSLRDFLIQLKEFSGDNAELYLEERETEAQTRAQSERENAMRIPGMLKPSQLEDKDEDI